MKIIVVNKFYYRRAGAERYVFDLIDLLTKKGHEVIPFAMHHPQNERTPYENYFVSFVDFEHPRTVREMLHAFCRMLYSFEAKRKFRALVREVKPDLIHINNIYHQISPSILHVAKKERIPVVQTVHDYKLICPNYKLFARGKAEESKSIFYIRDIFYRTTKHSILGSIATAIELTIHRLFRIYERHVDAFIVPSLFVAQKLIDYGMPAGKINVLNHFFDSTGVQRQSEMGSYLLCIGRLSEEKGFDSVLRALPHAENTTLKILGDGPDRERLELLAQELHIADRVEFIGFKNHDDVDSLIRRSALVIVPSVWYEVFGYVILEAWAAGKLVLGSYMGAIPELLLRVERNLLFEAGNSAELAGKIEYFLQNPKQRHQIEERSKEVLKADFAPHAYYEQLSRMYATVLEEKARMR